MTTLSSMHKVHVQYAVPLHIDIEVDELTEDKIYDAVEECYQNGDFDNVKLDIGEALKNDIQHFEDIADPNKGWNCFWTTNYT